MKNHGDQCPLWHIVMVMETVNVGQASLSGVISCDKSSYLWK